MQEHLHVGRRTWKRQARSNLIFASIPVFFLLFGFPYVRDHSTTANGRETVEYYSFILTSKDYQPDSRYRPPLFILVPLWNPHRDAAGMQWLGEKNPWVQSGANQ
jgi:hypothetical protein